MKTKLSLWLNVRINIQDPKGYRSKKNPIAAGLFFDLDYMAPEASLLNFDLKINK